MMNMRAAIAETLRELPGDVQKLVCASVRFVVRRVPNEIDLGHGAKPEDRGLFIGFPVRSEEDEEGGELYAEEGADVASAQGAPELYAEDGVDVAEVAQGPPGGTIVLFSANIRPLNQEQVTAVLLHEIAHFLGETEESAEELGLG
jgi:hypothetical protein